MHSGLGLLRHAGELASMLAGPPHPAAHPPADVALCRNDLQFVVSNLYKIHEKALADFIQLQISPNETTLLTVESTWHPGSHHLSRHWNETHSFPAPSCCKKDSMPQECGRKTGQAEGRRCAHCLVNWIAQVCWAPDFQSPHHYHLILMPHCPAAAFGLVSRMGERMWARIHGLSPLLLKGSRG